MLYLEAPFHIIQGVSVFADHADPEQFYYLPAMPHLATMPGPAGEPDRPSLQLLRFRDLGEAGAGGFLNFTVSLGIDQEHLEEVRDEVRGAFGVSGRPRLSPVPLSDGKVRLMMLGKETVTDDDDFPPPTTAPDDTSHLPAFVHKIDHPSRPSLYGDNHAIFSVLLDEAGTTAVTRSLEGHMMPIGVVYELEFLGLRPAFNVRITANWERVQTHLLERTESRVLFFSDEVDEIVDELIEAQVIVIEVDNFLPEGEDSANVITNPTQVINQVKEMVLETFFEASLHPVSSAKSGWDQFSDTGARLSTMAVTGGWAGIATYSYKKVDLTRIDRKTFDFNLRERTTVRRRIYPQAHLEGMARRFGQDGLRLEDLVLDIDGLDPFFTQRTMRVINLADIQGDGIANLTARLRYGDTIRHVTLGSGTEDESVSWPARVQGDRTEQEVDASYTVRFAGATGASIGALTSEEVTLTGPTFEVDPARELYRVLHVPVTALDFPWDHYPHVQVDLVYHDPENGIAQEDRVMLNSSHSTQDWRWFRIDPEKSDFHYRITYRSHDHRDWATDWVQARSPDVLVRNPRPNRRTLTVVPAVSWDEVSRAFVDVSYRDPANDIRVEQSFRFSHDEPDPRDFSVALEDPDRRTVGYTTTLLLADNSLVELPPSTTLQNQVFVRADVRGHRVVTVRTEPVNFGAAGVREVRAELRYRDDDHNLDYATDLTLTGPGDLAFFEFDYVDSDKRSFTVTSLTIFTNGFTSRRPTRTIDGDEVMLAVT